MIVGRTAQRISPFGQFLAPVSRRHVTDGFSSGGDLGLHAAGALWGGFANTCIFDASKDHMPHEEMKAGT